MFKLSKSHKLNFLSVYKKAKHIYDDASFVKKRRRQIMAFKILKYFSYTVLFFIVIFLVVLFLSFKDIHLFYNSALAGKGNIESSIELILSGEYKKGQNASLSAQENFNKAGQIAEKYNDNIFFKQISYFQLQINDLRYFMLSAEIISKAVAQSAEFAEILEKILVKKDSNFNTLNIEDKKKLLEIIYKSSPELTGIKANIDLAIINLDNIGYSGVLFPFKQKIFEMENKLLKVQGGLETIIPLSHFVPVVLGYPEQANFLFLLQNSDELRPTGGFIGTYGILQTQNGDILRLDTHDIYHMDMPIKDVFSKEPPSALKKYLGVDKWYMRDANWSPNFPSSAEEIEWFYHAEDDLLPAKNQVNNFSDDFDGVIAITPKLITDLLTQIGPVVVDGQEFNQNNFVDLLQYKVEQEYIQLGTSSWNRKAIIGEIVKELKIKLFDLSPEKMYAVLNIFDQNFTEKNILLYFKDMGFQEIAREKNWAGEIKQTDSDYLMVVDANMASYKTDAVITRSIHYNVAQDSSNALIANLKLNYAHHGNFDWKTTRYRTYTRVYVPRASQLIKIKGVKDDEIEVYDEFGKTVFAFFASVEPGDIANIEIDYRLPRSIENHLANKNYALYVQKQPGNDVSQLTVATNFNENIESYLPTGFFANKTNEKSLEWDTELNTDRVFLIELDK